MIQRIQTVFLLVVVACSVCLLVFPFMSYTDLFNTFTLGDFKKSYCGFWYYTAEGLNILSLVLSLVCIFMFKKRMKQLVLTYLIGFLNVCLLTILLFTKVAVIESFLGGTKQILWSSYLPILATICAYVAGIFIKKDEELVRSAGRIR